ncbi:5'-nucleotidase C-terminal domain-containing protein [Paenisporosarcina cavernae]|uniref:Bifunctional metallophosphatase/5'-nucleotidase n=1 Tax=Paenisporosarcina cavernae TaxID=2320858 RepID=A0A385YR61_9BACL|nr:5'-nucleotidase C-terminal domain-containing protein [Paenisporosarcina cavernae]AYC28890.1 bifunctional metallophosphatase/5'-nucleotidase [Paenisporosarcina cavernae]
MLKNKKFLATSVTAAAVAAAFAPAAFADEASFSDVSDRYAEAVNFLTGQGITQGTTATTFGTSSDIIRADAAVLIARTLGFAEDGEYAESGFTDVPARAKWAVDALKEYGIVNGYDEDTFGSSDKLTRAQTAIMLANAAGLDVNMNVTKTAFTDVNEANAPYVDALVKAGITQGKTDTSFGAYANVTRGEMALFINRAKEFFGYMDLAVMHTNDTHSYLERAPYYATAIKDIRESYDNSILLDAGDVFSGDLYFKLFEGQATLDMMEHLGYDAMTFGNHEFDLGGSEDGHAALANFVSNASFPMVSANVDFSGDDLFDGLQSNTYASNYQDGHIYNGVVLDVNGEEVGVFGLTTEETPDISSVGSVAFSNYIDAAKKSVKAFEDMGVNKIIALTHIGFEDSLVYDNDKELAKRVEGIDIIIGGHTHVTEAPYLSTEFDAPTVISQAFEYGKALGLTDVTFNPWGEVTMYGGEIINTDPQGYPEATTILPDADAQKIVDIYKPAVDELKATPTGASTETVLNGERADVRAKETELGNLITDGMLAKAKEVNPETVIAVQNSGGIRTSIDAGEITYGDVLTVMPFGNALGIMNLTGAEIMTALEHSVSSSPEPSGAFLQVSGMKLEYNSSLPVGERVTKVEVLEGGEYVALDEAKNYYVATNTFTMKGGDGYDVFEAAYLDGRGSEPGIVDYESFIDYLVSLDVVAPTVEGRIVDVATPAAQ